MKQRSIKNKVIFGIMLLVFIIASGALVHSLYTMYELTYATFNVTEETQKLPQSAQNAIKDWDVVIVSSENMANQLVDAGYDITANSGEGSMVTGLTSIQDHTIYLSDCAVYAKESFAHEIGHVVDYENGWVSYTDEFMAIYEEEKDSYKSYSAENDDIHTISSNREFFAEIYKNLCEGNEKALKTVPKAAKYVEQFI